MGTGTSTLLADDGPLVIALLQVILHRHALSLVAAFGDDGDGGICLIALGFEVGDGDVHALDVEAALGKVVDDALTHRVIVLSGAVAGGQGEGEEQNCGKTHDSIIARAKEFRRLGGVDAHGMGIFCEPRGGRDVYQ